MKDNFLYLSRPTLPLGEVLEPTNQFKLTKKQIKFLKDQDDVSALFLDLERGNLLVFKQVGDRLVNTQ